MSRFDETTIEADWIKINASSCGEISTQLEKLEVSSGSMVDADLKPPPKDVESDIKLVITDAETETKPLPYELSSDQRQDVASDPNPRPQDKEIDPKLSTTDVGSEPNPLSEDITSIPQESTSDPNPLPQVIYRCKKCRQIVASQESVVSHERGKGFKTMNKNKSGETEPECTSIFVDPLMWMQAVQEGYLFEKLYCMGCKNRLGSFNWCGMQCSCGAWVNPAFQLHKSRIDECHI